MAGERLLFLDALRGFALILMVLNHTSRWWLDIGMGWGRYHLTYFTLEAATLFLFLVGFCLPLSADARAADRSGAPALVRKYGLRGLRLIVAGLVLNALVFPEDPFWSGGVLQTIGLSIVACIPALFLLRRRWGAAAVLAAAALLYLTFAWSFPWLLRWVPAHPVVARIWFFEFAPWPWIPLVLVGLVLGRGWVEARAAGTGERYLAWMAAGGGLCLVAFFAYDWWNQTPQRWMFTRDFMLNRHWIPRGATVLWGLGVALCLVASSYYLIDVRRHRAGALVILGRAAFPLYFFHQLIVLTLVNQRLGLRFNGWWLYAIMNLMLLIVLLYAGRAWLALERLVRADRALRSAPGGGGEAVSPRPGSPAG